MRDRTVLLLILCCVGLGLVLVAGTVLTLSAAGNPASACYVPGNHATIQAAVDDLACESIDLGAGTFVENVVISRSLSVRGQGEPNTQVQGKVEGSVFTIHSGAEVALSEMSIAAGMAAEGGGILNEGSLHVSNTTVADNTGFDRGGGITNNGVMTLTRVSVIHNHSAGASFDEGGGGIFNRGTLSAIACTLDDNSVPGGGNGGAIHNNGAMNMMTSTVSGNTVDGDGAGAGIYNHVNGVFTLTNSLLSRNESYDGAAIVNEGIAYVINSTLADNRAIQGGAVFNHNRMTVISSTVTANVATYRGGGFLSGGTLTVTNSTVSGNVVETTEPLVHNGGGGFFFFSGADARLTNSTLSGNSAVAGGGILAFVNDTISMTNVTIYGNFAITQAGGLHVVADLTTVQAANSIIAGNSGEDCSGYAIGSAGHNIAGDESCNLTGPGDLNETDPQLAPLGDNGGPTFTHAPLSSSPAIDSGQNQLCPVFDQRGFARPLDGDGDGTADCDIGAIEAFPKRALLPLLTR